MSIVWTTSIGDRGSLKKQQEFTDVFKHLPNDLIMKVVKYVDGGRYSNMKKFNQCVKELEGINTKVLREVDLWCYESENTEEEHRNLFSWGGHEDDYVEIGWLYQWQLDSYTEGPSDVKRAYSLVLLNRISVISVPNINFGIIEL
jgi:hypothetical protein